MTSPLGETFAQKNCISREIENSIEEKHQNQK